MGMDYGGQPGDYSYERDSNGMHAHGVLGNGATGKRDSKAQREAGGKDRQPGDQGSHLIPHAAGGRNDASNLFAGSANVNQIDMAHVERNAMSLAKDPNNTVVLDVQTYNRPNVERPDAVMMHVGVRDNTTGAVDESYHSFQNASHAQQSEWNETVDRYATEIDPLQDVGMTAEERELANELCGAENEVSDKLGSGCYSSDFDTAFLDGGAVAESDANMEGAEIADGAVEEETSGLEGSALEGDVDDLDGGGAVVSGDVGGNDHGGGDDSSGNGPDGGSGHDGGDDHGL